MLILELALTAILTTRGTASKAPAPATQPVSIVLGGAQLARAIKTEIESISGPGSVDISIDHETLYSVRVAVPNLRGELCTSIYDRELELYRLFPDLNFDFYLWLKPAQARSAGKRP